VGIEIMVLAFIQDSRRIMRRIMERKINCRKDITYSVTGKIDLVLN
jgi:hypothetical protein